MAEVRYRGQSHELSLDGGPGLRARFDRAHRERFDFAAPRRAVEVVTAEVRAWVPAEARSFAPARLRRTASARPARTASTVGGRTRDIPVHAFDGVGARLVSGPALVMQDGATLWVAPEWRGRRNRSGTLVLRRS